MSDLLQIDSFSPRLDEQFVIRFDNEEAITLQLIEAKDLQSPDLPATSRAPFSLLFEGPGEPVLPQRLYALQNETLGEIVVFLVPVGGDAKGNRYEAIFN